MWGVGINMYPCIYIFQVLVHCTIVLHTNHSLKLFPLGTVLVPDKMNSLPLLFLTLNLPGYELLRRHLHWVFFCFTFSQRLRCAVILSPIIILNTDIANWEFLDMSLKYLNNYWSIYGFKGGVENSSVYRENLNCLPTAATLRIKSVSYIGALFHTDWYVFKFRKICNDYHDIAL